VPSSCAAAFLRQPAHSAAVHLIPLTSVDWPLTGCAVCHADTLLDILSVEEMLLYTAELKRPLSEPAAAKRVAVEQLLQVRDVTSPRLSTL
jgi:hypothetical protein